MSDLAPSAASGSLLTGTQQPVSPSQTVGWCQGCGDESSQSRPRRGHTVNGASAAAGGALHSPQADTPVPSQVVTKLSPMDPAQTLPWLGGLCLNREGFLLSIQVQVGDYETKAETNTAQALFSGQRTEKQELSSQLNFLPSWRTWFDFKQ